MRNPKLNTKKKGRVRRALLVLLALLCVCGAAGLIHLWVMEWQQRAVGETFYALLSASVEEEAAFVSKPEERATFDAESTESTIFEGTPTIQPTLMTLIAETPIIQPTITALPAETPTVQPMPTETPWYTPKPTPSPTPFINRSEIDFPSIWQTCPDVVGWIRLADSVIDYPVVLGQDNDFYLHHLPDGTANGAGSIMMDAANSGDFGEAVNILHGHHMRNGSMFGRLEAYKREAYYRAHPVMRLYTPAGDCDVAVFAACTVNGYTFGYPTSFEDEAAFAQFVRKAVSATAYETDVTVAYGDRILLLSTCAYAYSGARFVVMGKIEEK